MNGRSAVILAALFLAGASIAATQKSGTTPAKSSAASTDAILAGAGDIADCADLSGAEATAKLLERIPGTVMAIGDLALPDGAAQQFANCYDKTWGRLKSRTRPAPGNHEFHSSGAAPYFDYFGAVAGDAKKGYYSYDLGTWHIIVLNSECDELGGCGSGSPQEKWLRSDLAAHPVACTLAYWHKPLFSSGAKHGNDPEIKPLWQALYEANADVVVNGQITITNASRPRIPMASATPHEVSANSSSAPAARTRALSARSNPPAKPTTPAHSESSS